MKKKNRRQIYVWDVNLKYFDELQNKSSLLNRLILKYRREIDNGL